jgi:hypothetical protein
MEEIHTQLDAQNWHCDFISKGVIENYSIGHSGIPKAKKFILKLKSGTYQGTHTVT